MSYIYQALTYLLNPATGNPSAGVTTTNYCPQNTTGFNDIDYTITTITDKCNYCPQDTTGFNDFDTPP